MLDPRSRAAVSGCQARVLHQGPHPERVLPEPSAFITRCSRLYCDGQARERYVGSNLASSLIGARVRCPSCEAWRSSQMSPAGVECDPAAVRPIRLFRSGKCRRGSMPVTLATVLALMTQSRAFHLDGLERKAIPSRRERTSPRPIGSAARSRQVADAPPRADTTVECPRLPCCLVVGLEGDWLVVSGRERGREPCGALCHLYSSRRRSSTTPGACR